MTKLLIGPHKEEVLFLVDTGAEKSTIRKLPKGIAKGKSYMSVVGAKGEPFQVPVLKDVEVETEKKNCLNGLLLLPEAEYNLLGRDLILKLNLRIQSQGDKLQMKFHTLTQEDEEAINPSVWYKEGETGKIEMGPIKVQIIDPHCPIRVKQYPIPMEGRKGLKLVVDRLLEKGTLEPCTSPHNPPILPVKKSDGSYRMVQDLRAVNQQTITKFPVVANPYTLLSHLSPKHTWYSVIDLKDAFWACPLGERSRDYFAFEWEDPETGWKQQLRWTVLPKGFTESPNLFGQTLEKILPDFTLPREVKLLQYVDDLLVAGETEEGTRETTIKLLDFLGEKGPKVSQSKLQVVKEEVKYLGHWLSKGRKKLDPDRVSGILALRPPQTKKGIWQILGLLGYCRPWLESYSEKVKFLYEK